MDQRIDWDLVVQLYKRNAGSITSTPGLMLVPKIKYEHVYLTNFSKMRVDLAAQVSAYLFLLLCIVNILQVLSESVSKALYFTGNENAFETAYFIDKMDKFFDVLNVSSFCEGKHKRKVFRDPFRSPDDFRMEVCCILRFVGCSKQLIVLFVVYEKYVRVFEPLEEICGET